MSAEVRGHVTHSRHQQLVDFVNGSFQFDLCSILRIFHCDEDVKILVQVLPVRLPSVLLLLHRQTGGQRVRDMEKSHTHTFI